MPGTRVCWKTTQKIEIKQQKQEQGNIRMLEMCKIGKQENTLAGIKYNNDKNRQYESQN